MPRIVAFLLTLALLTAACSNEPDGPDYDAMVDAWWTSEDMTVRAQSTVCAIVGADDGSGLGLLTEASNDDGVIDLLDGGELADTIENRVAVGAAMDRLVAENCG